MGVLQALTFSGRKILNILWKPDLISGEQCFAFETKVSTLGSPSERALEKGGQNQEGNETSLTQSLAGQHLGAQNPDHPP